jgi:hypothetical protein
MATDIDSLATGLDGHLLRLEIEIRDYEKHHFATVECLAICIAE